MAFEIAVHHTGRDGVVALANERAQRPGEIATAAGNPLNFLDGGGMRVAVSHRFVQVNYGLFHITVKEKPEELAKRSLFLQTYHGGKRRRSYAPRNHLAASTA
jgi:hypothetical protein